jgi:GT2 family glycosyltransferase
MIGETGLTVIVASYNSIATIEACLDSLKSQDTTHPFEVIVVDSSPDGTADRIRQKYSWIRLDQFRDRLYCGDARNVGISLSRYGIVAFVDSDCTADPNWIEEILRAHQSPDLAIGGGIANGNPHSLVGWAAYFCEFSRWMPGRFQGHMADIAGANMSYKKEAFKRFGTFIGGTYCSDTEFHWRMANHHVKPRFIPSIVIHHQNIDNFKKFMHHEFQHGRSFARVRVKYKRFSGIRRWLYSFFWPLIALKRLTDIARDCISRKDYGLRLLTALPLLIPGLLSWSAGEGIGYWKSGH